RPRFHCFHAPDRSRRRSHASWIWASQSNARSPATVGLISGSCSSARVFAPRFFQAPPRGECCFTLALRYDFTSIKLSKGLSPSSCRPCSAHRERRAGLAARLVVCHPISVTIELAGSLIVNDPPFTGIVLSGAWFSVDEVR